MKTEMEALADKICLEELRQEPSIENLAFRKTLVHGMIRWEEEKQLKDIYEQISKSEKEMYEYNKKFIEGLGVTAIDDFACICEACNIVDKIRVVEKPRGVNQNEECGVFKEVHVLQYSVGYEGDSFAGYIYAKTDSVGWIEIKYEC